MDYIVNLDYAPASAPQMTGAPESLYVRLENSGYNRYCEYMLRQPGVQENNVPPKGEGRGYAGVLGALVVNHPLAPFRACHEGFAGLKECRQEALFPDFPSKKFIKLPSFLTDKVLERDLNGIAQLQPGPAECERMNNCKNLI